MNKNISPTPDGEPVFSRVEAASLLGFTTNYFSKVSRSKHGPQYSKDMDAPGYPTVYTLSDLRTWLAEKRPDLIEAFEARLAARKEG